VTSDTRIPLIILGGRTPESSRLPDGVTDRHVLSGCKGAELTIGGRPLVQHVIECIRGADFFDPVVLAGPAAVYSSMNIDARILDTDDSFGVNIRNAVEQVHAEYPDKPVAFITCDVLPEYEELRLAIDDYRQSRETDLWFPLIRYGAAGTLGTSDWKPRYSVTPEGEEEAVSVLPGHLVIVRPAAIRRRFLYRLMNVTYNTRNRPVLYRTWMLFSRLAGAMTREDFSALMTGHLPRLWFRALRDGITAGISLSRGGTPVSELERVADNVLIWPHLRKQWPDRGVRAPVLDALSLARDIDTREEAREFDRRMTAREGSKRK